jgi:hypothetical protein
MLHRVRLAPVTIESYREVVPTEQIDELIRLGHRLRGLRVAHINATPYGGGRHPTPHQAGVPWGTSGVRQRNWGTAAQHPVKTATPPPATWPAGVPGRLHLGRRVSSIPDLAMSRRSHPAAGTLFLVTYRPS